MESQEGVSVVKCSGRCAKSLCSDHSLLSLFPMLLPEVMLLKEMNIVVIPVGIGSEVDVTEQELMPNVGDIINTSAVDDEKQLRKDIMFKSSAVDLSAC